MQVSGNFGVTATQILIPFVMTLRIVWRRSMILTSDSGTLIGKIPAGSDTWIFNSGYIWAAILIPLTALLSWVMAQQYPR
jgi:NNP family nitrate/nitrite transporter-like MFS transporter